MASRFLLVAGLAAALPVPAAALQSYSTGTPVASTVTASTGPDSAKVESLLARADEATFAGRRMEARRIYKDLISEQKKADQFAGTAMWRLALNYLYADEPRRAAEMLDELANAANRYGDPTLQLRATFESAILWRALKRNDLVLERVDRAKALLQSPAIPQSEKIQIKARMG